MSAPEIPPLPPGWSARPSLVVVPAVPETEPPRVRDWSDDYFEDPEYAVAQWPPAPAAAPVSVPAPAFEDVPVLVPVDVDAIADRAPSDDHAIDWDRVRAAVRRVRPVRTLVVVGVGLLPALWWAQGVAEPLSAQVSVDAAWATGVVGTVVGGLGSVSGGRFRRVVCAWLVVAAVGGTLIAGPTRHLVAAWIVGA